MNSVPDAPYAAGDIVIIAAFDEYPEHLFEVDTVLEDCVTGYALTGPFKGVYGEPDLEVIIGIHPG